MKNYPPLTTLQTELLYTNAELAHRSGLMRRYTDFLERWSGMMLKVSENTAVFEHERYKKLGAEKRSLTWAELPVAITTNQMSNKKMAVQIVKAQPDTGDLLDLSRVNIGFFSLGSKKREGKISKVDSEDEFFVDDVALCIDQLKAQIDAGLERYVENAERVAVWPRYID